VTRPLVGVIVAVQRARFGPWDQDAAVVPATLVDAARELGWLALLLTADADPDTGLRLLDGLIVPDWGPGADRHAETLAAAARARGLPVLELPASLARPGTTVADYTRALGELFAADAPVESRLS